MNKRKRISQCKIIHPTTAEVQSRFDAELFHKIGGDFEDEFFVGFNTNELLKEWALKGRKTENLIQSKNIMSVLELSAKYESNIQIAELQKSNPELFFIPTK
jgi:hypothetical protein